MCPTSQQMSNFLKFREFNPLDASFTCIHYCKIDKDGNRRRCKRVVNRQDRDTAHSIRVVILRSRGSEESLRQQLMDYAQLCCCKMSHRTNAVKLRYVDDVATEWHLELFGDSRIDRRSSVRPIQAPLQRFLPFRRKGKAYTLQHVLSSQLNEQDSEDGTLYMIRREEDPKFVKIGITRQSADQRFAFFESVCGFDAIPLRQIRHVACVRRVERLVHAELNEYRRECTTCVSRRECGSLHTEWFEVGDEQAMAVMERWALWMSDAVPYDASGKLKDCWRKFQLLQQRTGQLPTSKSIMEAWAKRQSDEEHLVKLFSQLHIHRRLLPSSTASTRD